MQIRALSVPYLSAHIIVRMQTTALWSGSWSAPTKQILLWISAPTVCPSARSDFLGGSHWLPLLHILGFLLHLCGVYDKMINDNFVASVGVTE